MSVSRIWVVFFGYDLFVVLLIAVGLALVWFCVFNSVDYLGFLWYDSCLCGC